MGLDCTVTRRKLVLNAQDSVTGWYRPSYSDEDIDMVVLPQGSPHMSLLAGAYAREDAIGRTVDPVLVGDQIHKGSRYYEVKAIKPWYLLDSFVYRDCQLAELPLYEEGDEPAESTAGSEAVDPRTRTKTFLDIYVDGDYITKQDGSTNAPFITAFGYPPYPFEYVFKSPKRRYVVYAIDEPAQTTAQIDGDGTAYGYDHIIPIHVLCVNQMDATGTNLRHKAVAELRRAVGNNPTGSLRLLDREIPHDRDLGSLFLYDREFRLLYRTDTS